MKEHLFTEFSATTPEQWKQQIESDLKGAGYEQLIFRSTDGVAVQPFYTSEDLEAKPVVSPPPSWNICEQLVVTSTTEANSKGREALAKGAESLWFSIASEEVDPKALFESLPLDGTEVFVQLQFLSEAYIKEVANTLKENGARAFLQLDPLSRLSRTGNYFYTPETDFKILNSLVKNNIFKSAISVDVSLYQNAGANIPQQLAFALAHLNEYLNLIFEKEEIPPEFQPQFVIAIGSNYFFEIAKIRALRQLYSTLANKYGLCGTCHILAQPSKRDKALYDSHVNMLRTTTQCMSAILGGANTIANLPYDILYHRERQFGERIARNQLLIMKNEAYFNKVANAVDGAYYIESLTAQFATAALELFKNIERHGGFLQLLKEGVIQKQIKESAAKEQELFDKGELILVGTNKFTNLQEGMLQELELDLFTTEITSETLIEPIVEKRLSEQLEQERLQKERVQLN